MLKYSSSGGSAVSFLIRAFVFAFYKLFVGSQPDDERDPFYFYKALYLSKLKFICQIFYIYLFKLLNLFLQTNWKEAYIGPICANFKIYLSKCVQIGYMPPVKFQFCGKFTFYRVGQPPSIFICMQKN